MPVSACGIVDAWSLSIPAFIEDGVFRDPKPKM